MKNRSTQAGVSLIEVLVVLVLLLIGILSVVQLFPPGFLINKEVAEVTSASALAKQEANRFTNASANLMDAIVPLRWDTTSQAFVFDQSVTPDDLGEADPNAYGIYAPYFSDANRFRRIKAESVRIPLPTTTTLGRGSVYMLSSGPFMDVAWGPTTPSLSVYGGALIRRPLPPAQPGEPKPYPGDFLGPSSYAVDYDNLVIGVPPAPYPRRFVMTYSYYDANNQAQTVLSQAFPSTVDFPSGDIPANYNDWIPLRLPAGARGLVYNSDTMARAFRQLTPNGSPVAWSNDPYEFYVDSPTIGTSTLAANVGVLVFNPLGHDFTEYTNSGPVPLTARIDYDVMDWHIIREDRPLPATPPYQVSLTLQNIKKIGDIEPDQTTYQNLFTNVAPGGNVAPFDQPLDMLVFNTTTGQVIQPANYTVDYKTGTVTFNNAIGAANASATLRFFYRAHGDWALQIQKAAASYTPLTDAAPNFSQYFVGGSNNVGVPTRLYFPLSEAGKTIVIREYWYRDNGGQVHRIANESFRVNSNRTLFETLALGGGNVPLTWIDIATPDKHPDAVAWDYTGAGYAATGVQGVSFRSRVLWRDGSTVTATGNGNDVRTRWRRVDLDTVLTRGQQ